MPTRFNRIALFLLTRCATAYVSRAAISATGNCIGGVRVLDNRRASSTMASKFIVKSGCSKGEFDGVILSTDLEPDDAIAISALAPKLRGVPLLCVVGEGRVDKRTMMAEMLASFGIDEGAVIVQGKQSDANFPDGVSEAYHVEGRPHKCTLNDGVGEAAVAGLVDGFLGKCESPFALLLKPPHEFLATTPELLSKTKAAIYGSFNVNELRDALLVASGNTLSQEELFAQQFGLMGKFGSLLWIERSASCGRDCSLEPDKCPPAIWKAIDADPVLTKHIQLWNSEMTRTIGEKVANFPNEIALALGAKAAGSVTSVASPESYAKLEPAIEKLDKRVKVAASIARCGGRQVCHADTLVSACLLDDDGSLTKFERKVKLEVDKKFKPTFAEDKGSSVSCLIAEAGPERDELIKVSFEKLVTK